MTGSTDSSALSKRDRIDRVRARAWGLHVLYRWETRGRSEPIAEVLSEVLRSRMVSARRLPALRRLIAAVGDHLDVIDRTIQASMDNWRLERLSTIDRSVLRIATAEILFVENTPPKVAIQEGIRMAGQYGGDESPRFVNGVLDAIYRAAESSS